MVELSLEYWNKLSSQFILMSVFLGGFSIALTANLLISKLETRLLNIILKLATTSSGGLLTTVFAITNILMSTTDGYPGSIAETGLNTSLMIGLLG